MENKEYFEYTELELNKLKKKDKKLSRAIDEIENIKRAVNSNVFETLIHSIIGQQITIQAQKTIWERLQSLVSEISPDKILNLEIEKLNQIGIPKKRISYILDIAQKVYDKEIDKIRFEKYRRRYAPYGSIASLYLWEISKSKVEEK